jgi:hypothetical protein
MTGVISLMFSGSLQPLGFRRTRRVRTSAGQARMVPTGSGHADSERGSPRGATCLFRLLGLHPGPDIDTLAAASLVGLPEHDTRQLLIELTQAHLIKQHIPGRYQFHDLLRVYASEQATSEEPERQRRAALHRVLDYYLHTGFAAYQHTGFTAGGPFSSYWSPTALQTIVRCRTRRTPPEYR